MKIYIQDCGVYGAIVVIANNETEAREMMSGEINYRSNIEVQEQEIKHGFIFSNQGDT